MKSLKIAACFLTLLLSDLAYATTCCVPQDYAGIQAAVDASQDSDSVILAPGRYSGLGNRNINLRGKKITISSTNPKDPQIINSTIIDCQGLGRAFVCYSGETTEATLTGLTIINGRASIGGAIYCYNNSSPTIKNCIISNCSATLGGAIACTNSNTRPAIYNCQIIANSAIVGGGGIYSNGACPLITNCLISGNFASSGGAVYCHNAGYSIVTNSTIAGNAASGSAGAVYCYSSSSMTLTDSILWSDSANNAAEILLGSSAIIRISYCDIQDPAKNVLNSSDSSIIWVQGNIALDPCFAALGLLSANRTRSGCNFNLRKGSPCIDAGDPALSPLPGETDIYGGPRLSGKRIDIGADEYKQAIQAVVQLEPKTLNLSSNGNWINCSITLPDNYDIDQIDTATIFMERIIAPAWSNTDTLAKKLMVKFDRSQVQQALRAADSPASLNVTGSLKDGTVFEGSDTIRLLDKVSKN